ncbi:MAG: hypothetical protein K2X50_06885 [Gammaproteobacteria bacterium]|nr:hypothetical protein [Gammaproteobacteria bacterium]
MSVEKTIASALQKMLDDLAPILKEQGFEVQNGQIFDLSEHGIHDSKGKVQHSDSQKALTDPVALSNYRLRAGKAMWNFATVVKKILETDGTFQKGRLAISQSSFIIANIEYLDKLHFDELGNLKPNQTASYASLVVDPTTHALAKTYHQFLTTFIENKDAILKELPGLVSGMVKSALTEAEKITQTLHARETEFEKMIKELKSSATNVLASHQPFFLLTEKIKRELAEMEGNRKTSPDQLLAFIKTQQEQLSKAKADRKTIEDDIETLKEARDRMAARSASEIKMDTKPIVEYFDATLKTLTDYLSKFDETVQQQQALLEELKQKEAVILSQMKDGKRNTPVGERPAALRAAIEELKQQKKILEDNQRIDQDLSNIRNLSPLKSFIDQAAQIKFPYPKAQFDKMASLLNLNDKEKKKLEIICDSFVLLDEAKKQRQEAVQKLMDLANKRLGAIASYCDDYIGKLREIRGAESASQTDILEVEKKIQDQSEQLDKTIQQELGDYHRKLEPLLISLKKLIPLLNESLKKKNIEEANSLVGEAQQLIVKIDELGSEYADCEPNKPDSADQKEIEVAKLCVKEGSEKLGRLIMDEQKFNERKKLFDDYFKDDGIAMKYLDDRKKQNALFDKLQYQFSFFRKPGEKSVAQASGDFIYNIGIDISKYVDSGKVEHLEPAIAKIAKALKDNRFPSRKSKGKEGESMNAMLVKLASSLSSEYLKNAPDKGLQPTDTEVKGNSRI